MRKVILSIGIVALLASCANETTKTEVTTTDSTSVAVDSTHTSVDTTKVETTSVK